MSDEGSHGRGRVACLALTLGVLLAAAACSGSSDQASEEASASPTTDSATSTTAEPTTTTTPSTTPAPSTSTTSTPPPVEEAESSGIGGVDDADIDGLVRTLAPVASGQDGADVRALQARLAELGFGPGSIDGSYGRRTTAAVAAFQGLVDLEPTGEADAETIEALVRFRYSGLVLRAGEEGDEVVALQERLAAGPFDPGPIDGVYGTTTIQAVWALEKLAGMPVDGDWGPLDEQAWQLLSEAEIGRPAKSHDVRWVEVDLSEQLMKVYDPGESTPTLISHASSGSGIPWENEEHSGSSVTPKGDFSIKRRISGWRESSLNIGRLYNPLYFTGGIALHGSASVPLYPASHGCIRLPMHVAEYLPAELPNGTPVHVLE